MIRYLFGPVNAQFAGKNLHSQRQNGSCLVFDTHGPGDFYVGAEDSWQSIAHRFPSGWQPDFIVLYLPYRFIPSALWQAPVPIVGLATDWHLLWHHYREVLRRCELVLTDTHGVDTLRREGIDYARQACLFGCDREWVDFSPTDGPRDIDILFVGNFHANVPSKRLACLGRLAFFSERWHVLLTGGVFHADYQRLLSRARIVFCRSLRGEGAPRAFEAIAAGALLFQEADNQELPALLQDRQHCVFYTPENMAELLDFYLENEGERRAIAEMGQRRVAEFTWENQWQRSLEVIAHEIPAMTERLGRRAPAAAADENLRARIWQMNSITHGSDPTLEHDLMAALDHDSRSPFLHNAMGLVFAGSKKHAAPDELLRQAAQSFQDAWSTEQDHVVAGLNLAEALILLEEKVKAIVQAQDTLAVLEKQRRLPDDVLQSGHCPLGFDLFRLEWERAAWQWAGRPENEAADKKELLRWRLHCLLAEATGDLCHYYEAYLARPDLAHSQAMLGHTLVRLHKPAEAVPHFQRALTTNPFDVEAAKGLHTSLRLLGRYAEQQELAKQRRLLAKAVPKQASLEAWFKVPAPAPASWPERVQPLRIVWQRLPEGCVFPAFVNNEIAQHLQQRGHELTFFDTGKRPSTGSEPVDAIISFEFGPHFIPPSQGHWVVWREWQFDSLPKACIGPLIQQADEVWAPSQFVRDSLVASGIPPTQAQVVPWAVSQTWLERPAVTFPLTTRKQFKFLFVGDASEEMGLDLAIRAFAQVFSAQDNVCLIVANPSMTFLNVPNLHEMLADLCSPETMPEIQYIQRDWTTEHMAELYAACDCLVYPFRAESFAMPVAQAMACGLPVIVTGYGPALELCRQEHAYLLPVRRVRFADKRSSGEETIPHARWAEPDLDSLRLSLREVFMKPQEARAKAARAREFVRNFTSERIAALVESRLQGLRKRPLRRDQLESTVDHAPETGAFSAAGRPRVSLTMIVKNEESNLPACLLSVRDLVDEIIVVDTGSTDSTVAIAERLGAKVFHFPWVDSFAAARNESLRHASGEWIFWLDADDRLDEDNRTKLRNLLTTLPDENAAYVMKCFCPVDLKSEANTTIDHVRLFRSHPALRWQYRIHEQILVSLQGLGAQIHWSDIVIEHVGYQDPTVRKPKLERDIRLLSLQNEDYPDDPFTLFNLGAAYQEQGQFGEALVLLRRSLQLTHPTDSIARKLYSLIAHCQLHMNQVHDALETCHEGRRHFPEDAELLYLESNIRHREGDRSGAIACLEQIVQAKHERFFASVDVGIRGYKARHNLAIHLREESRLDEALFHAQAVVDAKPDFVPGLLCLGDIYLAQENWPETAAVIERLRANSTTSLEASVLSGRLHLACQEFAAARTLLMETARDFPQAISPRLVLSEALLRERKDWAIAEQLLREILDLCPEHLEAKTRLARLLSIQA